MIRTSVLGDPGDMSAAPGSREWAVAVCLDIQATLNDVRGDAEHLDVMIGLLREHRGYRHLADRKGRPFASYEAFCVAPQPFGLGYRVDDIDRIIGERKDRALKDKAAKANSASTVGAQKGNRNALKLPPDPIDDLPLMQSAAKNKPTNGRIVSAPSGKLGPNTQDRLTARIARDRPDILDRMKAGEYPSVRKAALEAGIIRPEFSCPCDPRRAARRLLNRFQGDSLVELIRLLADHAGIEVSP